MSPFMMIRQPIEISRRDLSIEDDDSIRSYLEILRSKIDEKYQIWKLRVRRTRFRRREVLRIRLSRDMTISNGARKYGAWHRDKKVDFWLTCLVVLLGSKTFKNRFSMLRNGDLCNFRISNALDYLFRIDFRKSWFFCVFSVFFSEILLHFSEFSDFAEFLNLNS